jgi:hypothetical protein
MALVHKQTIPTERLPLVGKVIANSFFFVADRRCRVVSATNPHSRILGFLGWSCYFSIQVAPRLSSQG